MGAGSLCHLEEQTRHLRIHRCWLIKDWEPQNHKPLSFSVNKIFNLAFAQGWGPQKQTLRLGVVHNRLVMGMFKGEAGERKRKHHRKGETITRAHIHSDITPILILLWDSNSFVVLNGSKGWSCFVSGYLAHFIKF